MTLPNSASFYIGMISFSTRFPLWNSFGRTFFVISLCHPFLVHLLRLNTFKLILLEVFNSWLHQSLEEKSWFINPWERDCPSSSPGCCLSNPTKRWFNDSQQTRMKLLTLSFNLESWGTEITPGAYIPPWLDDVSETSLIFINCPQLWTCQMNVANRSHNKYGCGAPLIHIG